MTALPHRWDINEAVPSEGFQICPGPIPTADKTAPNHALSHTDHPRLPSPARAPPCRCG